MRNLFLLGCIIFIARAVGQQQSDPCANVNKNAVPNGPPFPSLPTNAFKTTVRAQIQNKLMSVEATEYVDETRKASALYILQNMTTEIVIAHYDTNEIIDINDNPFPSFGGDKLCIATNVSLSYYSVMFGESPSPGSKIPHFFSTSGILGIASKNNQVYKGVATIDGVPTNHWTSCMYWDKTNSNFTVDYYFTLPNYPSASGLAPVPVMAVVAGTTYPLNQPPYHFSHNYLYVNFEPYVDDPEDVFNTPPGVFCIGRQSLVPMPNISNSFYYREEVSDPLNMALTEVTIWYDFDLKMVRLDSKIRPSATSKLLSPLGPYTVIHDYNTGVQYAIDKTTGLCSIDPIPADATGFDASQNITRDTLSMRNPLQFFNLQGNMTYAGVRTVRGLQADVFQRFTNQIAGRGNVVYEIYFFKNTEDDTDVGQDSQSNSPVPAMIMEWENGQLVNQYSIHDFDQDSPRYSAFDISPCFDDDTSIDFEIAFQVPSTAPLVNREDLFLGWLRLGIAVPLAISPLRLQNTRMHWEDFESMVYLQGTLLDRAPSIARYEKQTRRIMQGNTGRVVAGVMQVAACADQCNLLKDWDCTAFDYCPRTRTCTLAAAPSTARSMTLVNSSNCDHYSRVLGTKFNTDPTLIQAWNNLRDVVYAQGLSVNVPLTPAIDTPSDVPQSLTLTAQWVSDEVMTTGARVSQSAIIKQFRALPLTTLLSPDTMFRGLSVDDCAAMCTDEMTFNCQSFAFCWDAGTCFTSHLHPEDGTNMTRSSSGCDLYFKNYTANYQRFDGETVLSNSDTIYQKVFSENGCAKLCTYYTSFNCKSFDYCPYIATCFLGRQHFYDVPKANIQQVPTCTHFSRNYLNDFTQKARTTIQLRDNRIVTGVTAAECAKMCVEEPTFTCLSFDYCRNHTECRLSDASVSNTGQVTLEASATCSVYNRQGTNSQTSGSASQQSSGSDSNKFTPGAMGGLGIAMIVCGVLLGVGVLFLFLRLKNRQDDGMTVQFKNEDA